MTTIDKLRRGQEQRLIVALESWKEAKRYLENAVALSEAREREFRDAEEDMRRRIEALDLVAGMSNDLDEIATTERSLKVVGNHPVSAIAGNSSAGDEQLSASAIKALAAMDRILSRGSALRNQAA